MSLGENEIKENIMIIIIIIFLFININVYGFWLYARVVKIEE